MAVKILQMLCRNRAYGKYLKLNGVGFSENFSQYARNSTGKGSGWVGFDCADAEFAFGWADAIIASLPPSVGLI